MDAGHHKACNDANPSATTRGHSRLPKLPEWAKRVLLCAPVAYVGMTGRDGPYVVPVSFTYVGSEILFHGGPGKKSRALEHDCRVCVAVTTDVAFVRGETACKHTFEYRSVLVYGEARRLTTPSEIERALRLLTEKYDPAGAEAGFDGRLLDRTWVHAVRVQAVTCKAEPPPDEG
jgi:nitroimidazol reductase NimA-like FMN-containing flavoprotein (pyridoxamine 5'-phosphate oxidase superfamily)